MIRTLSRDFVRARFRRQALALLLGAAGLCAASMAQAEEKFVYMTNWYAQAEHGGFYQAIATGLYKKAGLDVTIKMGGPQVNVLQVMAAGQADCVMGSSNLQMMQARANGLPVVTIASMFQKDPQALIAHEDVQSLSDLKDKTILIASAAHQGFWPWLKNEFGFTDAQTRPYTFNVQPFVASKDVAQQGYITSETFAISKAGVKFNAFLFADAGYPAYATTVTCMDDTVKERPEVLKKFVQASLEGWKSYLADPAPGNALIKKDNTSMTDEQLAYSVEKIKEYGLVTGGDASTHGIGYMSPERVQQGYDFLVKNNLLDPSKVKVDDTVTYQFMDGVKVLP